jgi:UDP-N-acetylglucosamine 2-epimerase (non-hydrolysing)
MQALSVVNVVGGCANFIKMAPLLAEMRRHPEIRPVLVDTGPYDDLAFFEACHDLDLPEPDFFLNVGSGSHARQTALIMQTFEGVLFDLNPDLVLVVGDVDSTVAASMTAIKLGFPVAHVEAGLRSFDREMPEEINRILTDSLSDLLFTSERSAVRNLQREGVAREKIMHVGTVLIDALMMKSENIARSDVLDRLLVVPRTYSVITVHRSSNVDDASNLDRICAAIEDLQKYVKFVFPLHPQTTARLQRTTAWSRLATLPNLQMVEPPGYLDFMKLLREAIFTITDSGGIQEAATALGVPCLTLCSTTERPVTVTQGTNRLVGTDTKRIVSEGMKIINGSIIRGRIPHKWDGQTSKRIVGAILKKREEIKQLYRSVRQRAICSNLSSISAA